MSDHDNEEDKVDIKVYSPVGLEEPASRTFTDEERKQIAFILAINAAVLQFIIEGYMPVEEQIHFMAHLQDYVARLYANDTVFVGGKPFALKIDSAAGDAALSAMAHAIKDGKLPDPKQTTNNLPSNAENSDVETKPTVH